MTLPDMSNYYNITSLTAAAKYADSTAKYRVKLKRRYVSGAASLYDTDWITITSYLTDTGLTEISWGLDEQRYIFGTRNPSVNLQFDNSQRKFNNRTDNNSLWYHSSTAYYLNDSLIDIELGFSTPDGTEYYDTFFRGLIDGTSISYDTGTIKLTVFSLLKYFKTLNINEIIDFDTRVTQTDLVTIIDQAYSYIAANAPSAYSITTIANAPRSNIMYSNINDFKTSLYDVMNEAAQKTGSIFGITRNNEVFLSYFGAVSYNTISSFDVDSNTSHYWSFAEAGTTSPFLDSIGTCHFSGGSASVTAGKFGTGRRLVTDTHFDSPGISISTTSFSIEVLARATELGYGNEDIISAPILNYGISYGSQGSEGGMILTTRKGETVYYRQRSTNTTTGYLYDSSVVVPMHNNFWYHLSYVMDRANSEARYYCNGVRLQTVGDIVSSGTSMATMAPMIRGKSSSTTPRESFNIELDSMRMQTVALTNAQILANTHKIFGSKSVCDSTSSYTFSNFGVNQNIVELGAYNDGYNKIINKVSIEKEVYPVWRTRFYFKINDSTSSVNFTLTDRTSSLTASVTNEASLTSWINTVSNYYATLTTGNYYTIKPKDYAYPAVDTYLKISGHYSNGAYAYDFSASSDYLAATDVGGTTAAYGVMFRPYDAQKEYNYENTASSLEFGDKMLLIDDMPDITSTQASVLATSIFAEYAQPKVRMQIKARYLEGNLDLLNRVTVNWEPPFYANGTRGVYNESSWNNCAWAVASGAILWETKNFYIIGIKHNIKEKYTEYNLREV